jgi:L-seryl-tRNA(Ser) seleniumtransferase
MNRRATNADDPFERWNLTPVINLAGTMTSIGASKVHPEITRLVAGLLGRFVSIDELQTRASEIIGRATGAEAGCVTGCSAAAITQTVAAAITGLDLAAIERLPDVSDRERRVAVQAGHLIHFGGLVGQTVALAGAELVPIGSPGLTETWHLDSALEQGLAAALYVISHHTVGEGELPLDLFIERCHAQGVPVIVDMASEYDLRHAVGLGADAVIWSGHKFMGGITSGIVAGRRDLIRATYLQHRGIGRTMKAGKESVAGAMAALDHWQTRDHAAAKKREDGILTLLEAALVGVDGLDVERHDDWTGNPITRLKVTVDAEQACLHAWELAARLAVRRPKIMVRDDLVEQGAIYLDPCNVDEPEARLAAAAIADEVALAKARPEDGRMGWAEVKRQRASAALAWLRDDRLDL